MRKSQEKPRDETLTEAVARGKRERLCMAVMTRSWEYLCWLRRAGTPAED
jgi:hypothetical protein